jgi:adsorption protein B
LGRSAAALILTGGLARSRSRQSSHVLLKINLALLAWRLAMRFGFVTQAYGWREGLRSIPRVVISNVIAMLAARRAVFRYLGIRKSGRTSWDKTTHAFPAELPAE